MVFVWLIGWFLAVSAIVPALILFVIFMHGLALLVFDRLTYHPDVQDAEKTLADEIEEFLESQP